MAPCGARWMYSSLGTSDGSKAHASSPPIATIIIKLNLTVFLLSRADNVESLKLYLDCDRRDSLNRPRPNIGPYTGCASWSC
jgi:hypothetical protein